MFGRDTIKYFLVDVGDVGSGQINRGQAGSFDCGSAPQGRECFSQMERNQKTAPTSIVSCGATSAVGVKSNILVYILGWGSVI